MTSINYLTHEDVQNFGPEVIDVVQRGALNALAPTLQAIQQQNAELQRRLAVESRRRLDDQVSRAVPDYQTIDRDPRWHRWLLGVDSLSGRVRQQWLNDAISAGDAARVKFIFDSFRREVGGTQPTTATQATSTRPTPFAARSTPYGARTYTPEQIRQIYENRRKGRYSDSKWAELEQDIFKAQAENWIVITPYITK